jgi:hypothetical protein
MGKHSQDIDLKSKPAEEQRAEVKCSPDDGNIEPANA